MSTTFAQDAPCYLLTGKGTIMPATFKGTDHRGLYCVAAPQGRIYTCNPLNVLDVATGAVMLAHARAEQMAAQGYQIAVRFDRSFRVYQPAKHGSAGGWIVRSAGDALTCNCPAFEKSKNCKHQLAICSLLHRRADRLQDAGKIRVASRYRNLAGVIHQAAA